MKKNKRHCAKFTKTWAYKKYTTKHFYSKDHRNKNLSDVASLKKLAEDRENFKNLVLELLKNSTVKPSEDNINLAFNELNQIYALGRQK